MTIRRDALIGIILAPVLLLGPRLAAQAGTGTSTLPTATKELSRMHATGSFNVTLTPQTAVPELATAELGRMRIDKQFQGDLDATSLGEMLAVRTKVQDSAGYVALERVTGTLHGRQGSFALQHSGTMDRGAQSLTLTVVPDSGTGALTGLRGSMTIGIDQGKHNYTMDYVLP